MTTETEIPEWADREQALKLSAEEIAKILELNRDPPEPNEALRSGARLHREELDRRARSSAPLGR